MNKDRRCPNSNHLYAIESFCSPITDGVKPGLLIVCLYCSQAIQHQGSRAYPANKYVILYNQNAR